MTLCFASPLICHIASALPLLLIVSLTTPVVAREQQVSSVAAVAMTPPMGWSSWNTFACQVNETLIRSIADVIANGPLAKAGYTYVNIDDCWSWCKQQDANGHCLQRGPRDASGRLVADPVRFPSGMRALGEYIHSKGLKFGMYTSSGVLTCANFTGSWGYEDIDATAFADWGVDYVKMDACYTNKTMRSVAYPKFSRALRATGRDIVFSCDTDELFSKVGNTEQPWVWGPGVCNLWRIWGDIDDTWKQTLEEFDHEINLGPFAGPGGWNDPDMLTVGMGGQSLTEYQTQFGLWCLLAAPLIIGADVRHIDASILSTLAHLPLIKVNQDPLGIQGSVVSDFNGTIVFAKPLADDSRAVAFFNRDNAHNALISVNWGDLWQDNSNAYKPPMPAHARVYDLWTDKYVGVANTKFVAAVQPHETLIFRIEYPFA